ncbi:MAG: type II secretion system secretin GspD [Gammaproteobacteria bacterium]|nr:type II secretion system secretin GspD [Gammaproteobacteria bacterium]
MLNKIRTIMLSCLLLATAVQAEEVTLNFSDADLTAVVNSVSQITGKNFIIDPRVKGKVTVVSSKPLNEDEVYNVFLSILQVHGFATVPTKNAIKIIPDAAAKQDSAPFIRNNSTSQGDQLVTQVIEVQNVNATQLVPILRPLVAQQGHLAAYAATNVLIVSDRASNIRRINQIIVQIDQKSDAGIEFIKLEHAFASEVVRLLTSLSSSQAAKAKAPAPDIKFSADERTNSILLSGEKNERLKYRAIIAQLDQPVDSAGNIHVVYLRYANADNLAKILGTIGKNVMKTQSKTSAAAAQTASAGDLNIQADEVSNALVITAPMSIYRSLRTVIQQLDIPRAQVHIEAIIAEVSVGTSNELGVQWVIDGSPNDDPALITNFSQSGLPITGLAAGGVTAVGDGMTLGLGRVNDPNLNFVALIRALSGDSDSNLLSTPSIVTLDNQEADIIVGENVPFITGEYSSTTGTSGSSSSTVNPFRTIERQDVGVSLKVKPQINEGDTITMEIQQEVSDVTGSSTGVDLITSKRSLNTTVQLEDGELLVLGGLINEALIEQQQKVPGLGDIPVLGALFRSKTLQKQKRNLLIFIRASIIKDPAKARLLSQNKYNFMREEQLSKSIKFESENPVLKQLDELNDLRPIAIEEPVQSEQSMEPSPQPEGLGQQ